MTLDTDRCPARPQRLNATFQRSGDQLLQRCRSRERGGGVFMLLWLVGWTVGCVFLAGLVIRDPKPFHFLFAIPFWASWIFVFCMLLKSFFQREELLLDRLELRPDDSSDRRRFCGVNQVPACTSMGAEHYRLSLVDQNNRELCSIPSLTEGEARWIGDTLLKERGIWFR